MARAGGGRQPPDAAKAHDDLAAFATRFAEQVERGQAYRRYLESALARRQIVGAHWFQCADRATTGRGDGENYQVGIVDVCDTPYAETIDACRSVGDRLYQWKVSAR